MRVVSFLHATWLGLPSVGRCGIPTAQPRPPTYSQRGLRRGRRNDATRRGHKSGTKARDPFPPFQLVAVRHRLGAAGSIRSTCSSRLGRRRRYGCQHLLMQQCSGISVDRSFPLYLCKVCKLLLCAATAMR